MRGIHERVFREREEPVADRGEELPGGAALEVGAAAAADQQRVAGEDLPRGPSAEAAATSTSSDGGRGRFAPSSFLLPLVRSEVEGAAPFRVSRGRQRAQREPPEDESVFVGLEADVGGGARGLGDGRANLFLLVLFRKDLLELSRARDVIGVDVAEAVEGIVI